MSLALLDRAQQLLPDADAWVEGRHRDAAGRGVSGRDAPALPSSVRPPARGGCTLDRIITARWQEIVRGESVRCPVCGGQMVSHHGHATGVQGRCRDCGSTLA